MAAESRHQSGDPKEINPKLRAEIEEILEKASVGVKPTIRALTVYNESGRLVIGWQGEAAE